MFHKGQSVRVRYTLPPPNNYTEPRVTNGMTFTRGKVYKILTIGIYRVLLDNNWWYHPEWIEPITKPISRIKL